MKMNAVTEPLATYRNCLFCRLQTAAFKVSTGADGQVGPGNGNSSPINGYSSRNDRAIALVMVKLVAATTC